MILLISGVTQVVACQYNDSKDSITGYLAVDSDVCQSAFDPSKVAAEVVLPEDLNSLRKSLSEAGYKVKIQKPPMEGAYGLVNKKSKTIWITPIAKEMGVFRTTFIHESVHAAQACKTGEFEPIGWNLEVDEAVRISIESILYRRYPSNKFEIERRHF